MGLQAWPPKLLHCSPRRLLIHHKQQPALTRRAFLLPINYRRSAGLDKDPQGATMGTMEGNQAFTNTLENTMDRFLLAAVILTLGSMLAACGSADSQPSPVPQQAQTNAPGALPEAPRPFPEAIKQPTTPELIAKDDMVAQASYFRIKTTLLNPLSQQGRICEALRETDEFLEAIWKGFDTRSFHRYVASYVDRPMLRNPQAYKDILPSYYRQIEKCNSAVKP